jgi:acyl carrier protein
MSVKQEVIDIVVDKLGLDPAEVTADKSFIEDLNADSLDSTEIMMTIEERFDIEIAEDEIEKLKTVGDAIKFVEDKKGA